MKKAIISIILFFVLVSGSISSGTLSVDAAASERATWLWNPWVIVSDGAGTIALLQKKQVNKVYMQIDRDIPMKIYRSFIGKAFAKGIQVYALDGSAEWVAPKGYISQNQLMSWIGKYQSGSTSAQKFAGVHLDVEPYLYSGWRTNQAETIKSYQSLLMKAKSSTAALNLPLEADIPFWFDEISYKNTYGKGLLTEWVIAKTNGVTVMAYRDSASLIIDIVKNEITLAEKYKKSIVVGVETGDTEEGDTISFFEEGESYMNRQLIEVKNYYAGVSALKGIAVHHISSWMTLRP